MSIKKTSTKTAKPKPTQEDLTGQKAPSFVVPKKPKKKPVKAKRKVSKFSSKSELIRSLPKAPAKKVVEAGKRAGFKFTERYVYAIRSNAKRKGKAKNGRRRSAARQPSLSSTSQLRKLIAEAGLAEARKALSDVEAAFGIER